MVRSLFPDTLEEKVAREAMRRLYFRKQQIQVSEVEWQKTVVRAQESVDNLEFGNAIASFNVFRRKHTNSNRARSVGQYAVQVEQLAEETYDRFIEKAQAHRAAGNTNEARAIYQKIISHWHLDRFVLEAEDFLDELEPNGVPANE